MGAWLMNEPWGGWRNMAVHPLAAKPFPLGLDPEGQDAGAGDGRVSEDGEVSHI